MDNSIDVTLIAKKSVKGVAALISRTFLIQILGIVASFILTIYLDPASFGIFFVVSSIIVFFNYFSDIGLAAALIQKKEAPTLAEYRNVFTTQQILVLLLVIPAIIFVPHIADFYSLDIDGKYLLYAFFISFFLSSLKTIPTVMLERNLNFEKLVIPQIIENLVYNCALIYFVISGYGVNAFTIAVILRGVTGLIATYWIQPWKVGVAFSYPLVKSLMKYGVPFQLNSILALLKDDLLAVFIAKILPLSAVGYIGFAQKWAFLPLRLVMDNVIKVTFPSYSRLQDDKVALARVVEKSLFLISLFIFPIVIGIIFIAPLFVEYIPDYQKWKPALIALSFYSLNSLVASVSVPLTNFLNAIGKIKTTLYFMIFLTATTWIATIGLVYLYGYNGVAAASFLVAASGLSIVYFVKKHIQFHFLKQVYKQCIAAICMAISIIILRPLADSIVLTCILGVVSVMIYGVALVVLAKDDLIANTKFIMQSLKKS
jgi:O-antigen/teichoic acid export membrane protein